MASISHSALLYKAAKKLKLSVSDVSLANDKSRVLIADKTKSYVAADAYIYPTMTAWVRKLMDDKMLAQKLLKKHGYRTIPSHDMRPHEYVSETAFLKAIAKLNVTYPAITKTNVGTYGQGITFIANQDELKKSAQALFKSGRRFMVQPVTWDDEYRITLIEKKPIMVHKKRLPRVVGDGKKTLRALIDSQPIALRDKNFIAWNLKRTHLKKTSVLAAGEIFETHIIKKRTPEYYKTSRFPSTVVAWGTRLLHAMSATTVAIDFTAPRGLQEPDTFVIFEINANPHWNYVIDELDDHITPQKICEHILTSYFTSKRK